MPTALRAFGRCTCALATVCVGVGLAGCAGVPWERAFYKGLRAPQPSGAANDTNAVPRQTLPSHAQYERERQALRPGTPREPAASSAR